MNQALWTEVDDYFAELFVPPDPVLEAVLEASDAAGLPPINVAPNQGKLLMLLAKIKGAQRILEIGTLGGYSTIWLARGLPLDGRLVTLEADARHAKVARENIARAGLSENVDLRLGAALDTLATLVKEKTDPFDLIFIDADKPNNPRYFAFALELSRPGTLIIADNVVRDGAVAREGSRDASVEGIRRYNELMAAEPRVTATAIQTVGSKGYDGLAIALVT
jgi:predicted O-methyltransferase YrrM